ncbi:hypothetical protein GGF46_003365 [Coemansia sp. RSA 552]|nr:hypothetical protein GGF46_003365 [Coemansia sp. RSA 552]
MGSSSAFGTLVTFSSNMSSSTASDVFDSLLPILPSLLHYLDSCLAARARFRNDVELDDLGSTQRSSHIASVETLGDVGVVEECIDTLLQILSSVLYWDGLQQMDRSGLQGNRSALTSVLGALAKQGQRTDASELEEMATGVLVRRAFDYLLGLTAAVATSTRVIDVLRMLVADMVHDAWVLAHTYTTHTLPTYIQNMNPLEQPVDDEEDGELLLFVDRVVASWLALMRITQKVDVAMQRLVLLLSLRSG